MIQTLGIVTVARSDWGHLKGLSDALTGHFNIELFHDGLSGIDVGSEIQWFTALYRSYRPDAVLIFGDRWEQMAAAVATITHNIPIIHLHAGEWTPNVFDNQCRRVISSLAHLFLVAHEIHKERLILMGMRTDRIHVTGAPGLDRFNRPFYDRETTARRLNLNPDREWAVVLLHPTTFRPEDAEQEWRDTQDAIAQYQPIFFAPGNDPGRTWLKTRMCETWESLDDELYCSLLRHAAMMIGNSSALLIDAPFIGLKTVEIGHRQAGRDRVPYGDGQSIPRIVNILKPLRFRDLLCEVS